jgi:hypothetical protein
MFVRVEIERNAYSKVNSDATINRSLSLHLSFPARKPSKKHMNHIPKNVTYQKKQDLNLKLLYKSSIS